MCDYRIGTVCDSVHNDMPLEHIHSTISIFDMIYQVHARVTSRLHPMRLISIIIKNLH
jgi:hypothetical protein